MGLSFCVPPSKQKHEQCRARSRRNLGRERSHFVQEYISQFTHGEMARRVIERNRGVAGVEAYSYTPSA